MKSRLDDLLATAEMQLASRSFDAAMDTYRTALTEPGAGEAGVPSLLAEARRLRDEARGVAQSAEPPAPPVETPAEQAASPAQPRIEPEPAPAPEDYRPIEPPAFHLIEDDPSMIESSRRGQYVPDVEHLSILDPTPLPEEEPGPSPLARIVLTLLIVLFVCGLIFLASHRRNQPRRFSLVQSAGQTHFFS